MKTLILIGKIALFAVLTLLTQIGGMIYLLLQPLFRRIDKRFTGRFQRWLGKTGLYLAAYLIATLCVVPLIARPFGRVPMPLTLHNHVRPQNILTCLLNRHYVRPQLRQITEAVAQDMANAYPGTELNYLDGCFPFINKFPLFPHLSHNDGKKLDLSFCYIDARSGTPTNKTPSAIGYGICEEPRPGEKDQPCFCAENGYWQYNFMRHLVPQGNKKNFIFDSTRTRAEVLFFAKRENIGKIFIEPHLKTRLELAAIDKIRYHGCHAVRHDDHIHVQLN